MHNVINIISRFIGLVVFFQGKAEYPNFNKNYEFYTNRRRSQPNGMYIVFRDNEHAYWSTVNMHTHNSTKLFHFYFDAGSCQSLSSVRCFNLIIMIFLEDL